jgi:hypothetical protein
MELAQVLAQWRDLELTIILSLLPYTFVKDLRNMGIKLDIALL